MRIIYITTSDPKSQGDYQEVSTLVGLRKVLGDDCIDYPRKKIMYGDFSESPKNELHGWGFSLLAEPIKDIASRELSDIDFVLYGVTDAYGVKNYPEIDKLAKYGVWYLDGHDHSNISRTPCFKRELFSEQDNVYPIGFGIPSHRIRLIAVNRKTQLFAQTAPPYALFGPQILGPAARNLYVFSEENDYYNDIQTSFFGLTCMKGGWDSLRHYEIMAGGAYLLFRDYDKKPKTCSPVNIPCESYSSKEELEHIVNKLIVNNKPTNLYFEGIQKQREWLLNYGTAEARAKQIIETLSTRK